MGTSIRVELWSDDGDLAAAAIDAVMAEMRRIDRAMSPYKPESELSRVNREAGLRPVALSAELYGLVACAIEFSKLSHGAFDITYASVGRLFDYRERRRPNAAEAQSAQSAVGWQHLVLDPTKRSLHFAHPGTCIDLGGFAKGHAVDNAVAILRRMGIAHAYVSAGGDSRVLGDRRGRPWTIGVRDPRRSGEVVALLPLEDVAISTSGDYERYFEEDGVRYHHILDPRTGRSPDSIRAVTVLAPNGITAEGLSKSLFVLGLERGMQLVDAFSGVDAIVVDAGGALHYSSGLLAGMPQPVQ